MTLTQTSFLTDYGSVPCSLEPLRAVLANLQESDWVYRIDPESYKTKVVSEGTPKFPRKVVDEIIQCCEPYFGAGYWNRLVLSCVPAGEGILPHRDDFGVKVRDASFHCHIPLITSPEIVMGFPDHGEEAHLKAGHLYSMDETQTHYVKNPSSVDRVHLLFAYFPHEGKHGRA